MDLFAVAEWGKSSLEFILGADKGRSRAASENKESNLLGGLKIFTKAFDSLEFVIKRFLN
jgi:hypothetical protein